MKLFKRIPPVLAKKPANLAEWLDIATQNLLPQTQARIRTEIEAHYAEAVQANRKRGLPEAEAHAAALADLGEAQAAGKRFCREHPSTLDASEVAGQARFQIFMGTLMASGLTTLIFLPNPNAAPGPLGVLLILLFFFIVCPALFMSVGALVRRTRQAATQRVILMLLSLGCLNIGAYIFICSFDNSFDHSFDHGPRLFQLLHLGYKLLQASPFILITAYGNLCLLRLRKKLASAHEENLPPHTPAANL